MAPMGRLNEALERLTSQGLLRGRRLTSDESEMLRRSDCIAVPEWLIQVQATFPLVGTTWELSEEDDPSGLGVDMGWKAPDDISAEARDFYPGVLVAPLGYVPIGDCLAGSGDPYFLAPKTSGLPGSEALVRVPHEVAVDEHGPHGVELVATDLASFVERVALVGKIG